MFQKVRDALRIILTFLNIIVFASIVFSTEISTQNLIFILLIYIILGVIIFRWINKDWFLILAKYDYYGVLLPTVFNLFFLVNYCFSGREYTETYHFEFQSADMGNSTTINLENGVYKDIYFYRTFMDYDKIHNNNTITYQLAEGFFGLNVIKDYEFSRENLNFEEN